MTGPLEYAECRGGPRATIPSARAANAGMVRSSARKYGKPRISGNLSLYKAKAQLLSMAASKPKPKRVYCQGCGTLVGDGHEHTASDGTVWSPS